MDHGGSRNCFFRVIMKCLPSNAEDEVGMSPFNKIVGPPEGFRTEERATIGINSRKASVKRNVI